jgi:hypothetical protein
MGNSKLKNMMPLSLYEIMRKAYTAIISKRISTDGINYEVLHPGQYGYFPTQLLHHCSKIPTAMQDRLHRVYTVKVSDQAETDVKAAIDDTITFKTLTNLSMQFLTEERLVPLIYHMIICLTSGSTARL